MGILKDKSVLITGGTGSFGKCLVEKLLKNDKPKKIIIYSRDEYKQFIFQSYLLNKKDLNVDNKTTDIRFLIGDVRDKERLTMAMKDVDVVIHAAALKQVSAAEYNPFEAVKTNIIGAQNVIESSLECNVKKVVALSTDKASAPVNLYGATKLTSDKLFVAANNYKGNNDIKFSVVRYGNVMGSRGSVIPLFLSMKNSDSFPITDREMTRFNITLDQGVSFVIKSIEKMWGGEIFTPMMPSYKVVDLAAAIDPNKKLEFIGIRPGEKLHESIITSSDALTTIKFEDYYVICPNSEFINWTIDEYIMSTNGVRCESDFFYDSRVNSNFLTISQIKELIQNI